MAALLERADEWDALTAAVGAAGRSHGSVVLVSGEAGIGKTSLVRAFAEHVACRARRLVGGCDDLLTARPLGPLRDAAAGTGGPLEDALRSGGDVFAAVVAELSGPRVTAVVVEDLHWADPSTLEILTLLLDQVPTTRLLAVLTFRPEFTPPWKPRSHLSQLVLNRLGKKQVEAMIDKVTTGKELSAKVIEQIRVKTDGVPLFVEELTKSVVESAAVTPASPLTLAIPATLQEALLARLDRLSTARQVAQLGATIGREFSHELIQAAR